MLHLFGIPLRPGNGLPYRRTAGPIEAGAELLRFKDMANEVYDAPEFVPEDDEIVLLACRRITVDWVFRRHIEAHTDAVYRDGIAVVGLESEPDAATGLPRVTGVRVQGASGDEELVPADLVVDASGRNSDLRHWLDDIGAQPLTQETQACGIIYYSRFYQLLEGVEAPPMEGPIGADLGYMKYAIFPGDSRIFSITLATSPSDDSLRSVRRPEAFGAAALLLPSTRAWVDPKVSAPITDVYTYANLKDTLRFFVVDDKPLVLGLFPVGDALVHANPISGRGCTLAWLGANMLADALAAHPDDLLAFATSLYAEIGKELVPWYENMRDQDRASLEVAKLEEEGGDPFAYQRPDGTVDPKAYMRSVLRDGLIPALREDLTVFRAVMRVFNMLDAPKDVVSMPGIFQRVLAAWQRREEREERPLGPGRPEMVEAIESAAA